MLQWCPFIFNMVPMGGALYTNMVEKNYWWLIANVGKPSENDYDLNKSLGPFCSGAFGSSEGAMSAHRVSRCRSDCMHHGMYFALPCDALLVDFQDRPGAFCITTSEPGSR